jgi:hypothetical protein
LKSLKIEFGSIWKIVLKLVLWFYHGFAVWLWWVWKTAWKLSLPEALAAFQHVKDKDGVTYNATITSCTKAGNVQCNKERSERWGWSPYQLIGYTEWRSKITVRFCKSIYWLNGGISWNFSKISTSDPTIGVLLTILKRVSQSKTCRGVGLGLGLQGRQTSRSLRLFKEMKAIVLGDDKPTAWQNI